MDLAKTLKHIWLHAKTKCLIRTYRLEGATTRLLIYLDELGGFSSDTDANIAFAAGYRSTASWLKVKAEWIAAGCWMETEAGQGFARFVWGYSDSQAAQKQAAYRQRQAGNGAKSGNEIGDSLPDALPGMQAENGFSEPEHGNALSRAGASSDSRDDDDDKMMISPQGGSSSSESSSSSSASDARDTVPPAEIARLMAIAAKENFAPDILHEAGRRFLLESQDHPIRYPEAYFRKVCRAVQAEQQQAMTLLSTLPGGNQALSKPRRDREPSFAERVEQINQQLEATNGRIF
jgi:hypothetical protein